MDFTLINPAQLDVNSNNLWFCGSILTFDVILGKVSIDGTDGHLGSHELL